MLKIRGGIYCDGTCNIFSGAQNVAAEIRNNNASMGGIFVAAGKYISFRGKAVINGNNASIGGGLVLLGKIDNANDLLIEKNFGFLGAGVFVQGGSLSAPIKIIGNKAVKPFQGSITKLLLVFHPT